MKKTFSLVHEKIKRPRLIDAIKHEVKKYVKRERNKNLPEGADFLDFDCRYGQTKDDTKEIHLSAINKCIDEADKLGIDSFYLEILAKPGFRRSANNDIDEEELDQ
ncbi:DUF6172 family protein [Thalassotalea piscium]|uniref:Uncharacterized protein n=1 Tax=Thalassotalea piscium TaxID=1230533 RepID=A0A7X0NK99_9GAMM|nr:DUF6172 family protein [Thalassotalea piscium]MBB6545004.1 hypothetical protein [Thalassotalea piscium]